MYSGLRLSLPQHKTTLGGIIMDGKFGIIGMFCFALKNIHFLLHNNCSY